MNIDLANRINPPTESQAFDVTTQKATVPNPETGGKGGSDIDFLSVMRNSAGDVKEDRAAKQNGDFSNAKTYEEFMDKIQDQSTVRRDPKTKLNKDDFLKLFITQLQHQDPLNPDDGAEMASRLAQFDSLEQMLNVNKTLEKMVEQNRSSRDVELINYIGKEVSLDGGRVRLKGGVATEAIADVKNPVAEATMKIRDSSGTVVYERSLGTLQAGKQSMVWDGKIKDGSVGPDGIYTFNVEAKSINGETIPVDITSKATISGVDIKNKDGGLFTNLGTITLDAIKSVGTRGFEADAAQATKPKANPNGPQPLGGVAPQANVMSSMNQEQALQDQLARKILEQQISQAQGSSQPAQASAMNPLQDSMQNPTMIEDVSAANREAMGKEPVDPSNQGVPTMNQMIDSKGLNQPEPFAEKNLPNRTAPGEPI